MIEYDGNTDIDVDTRLAVARSMFNQLYPLWKSTTLSTRVKLKIFRVSVGIPVTGPFLGNYNSDNGDDDGMVQ